MTTIEVPDLYFTVSVTYPDEPEIPETQLFDVSIKLAGVTVFARRYNNNREVLNQWRIAKAQHAEGKAYDPGPRPNGFAYAYDDAKETCMTEFAEHLAEVLRRPDPGARY